jgi:CBS domain-containing protein
MASIETFMQKEMVTAQPGETVAEVARRMRKADVGAVLVMAGETLTGLFSERDLLNRVVAEGLDPTTTQVADVATQDVVTASPDASLRQCADLLETRHVRHLPVVDGGRPIGIISARDFFAAATRDFEGLIEHLRYDKQLKENVDPYDHVGGSYGR